MGWEQHRYAIERARDMRKQQAHHAIEANQGVSLQSEAAGGDAELLDAVADFLLSLDGSKPTMARGEEFVADWNQAIGQISNFCAKWDLPKPDILFHPLWQQNMSRVAGMHIGAPLIYAGVRVRFGSYVSMDVLHPS